MLARLGTWCHNRRGVVVIGWLVLLMAAGAAAGVNGSGFTTQFTPPDVESARGLDIIEEHFGGTGGGLGGTIVFVADDGVTDPTVQRAMEQFFAQVDEVDEIKTYGELDVVSPYSPEGVGQIAQQGELAGKVAFARIEVGDDVTVEDSAEITDIVHDLEPDLAGVQIEYGGQLFAEFAPPESEAVGLGFAIVILILGFGSVLAMGLPVGTAVAGIGFGTAIVTVLSNVVTMPDFTTTLAIMIGLGVGIDYALFIVTRYREGVHAGIGSADAIAIAINTAGRAVLFAGTTVVISLLGMLLMGLGFVNGLAIGAATVVAATMAASITLLPALVGFAAPRMEVTRWRGVIASGLIAVALVGVGLGVGALQLGLPAAAVVLVAGLFLRPLKREVPRRARRRLDQTLAYRWSRLIQARPWPAVILGSVLLIGLAVPVLSLRLGFSDEGNFPEDTSTRRAYDLISAGFGPGFNGPLVLAAELTGPVDPAALGRVSEQLNTTEGVAFATPPLPNDPTAPAAVLWRVIPTTAPQDEATSDLVARLRRSVLPEATAGTDIRILVTGNAAINTDFSAYLGERLPIFLGVVLGLSFLLLMAVFRSLLVPLKAVVMNLISIGAAYGLVVAIFQWGWGKDLIGLGKGGPIEPFVPMMMFAILFGLSMDYEVFLLSRVKEEYDRTGDNARAVADGLASTARVITAAAAIMVVVFGSFLLEADRVVKLFGIGLASAIFLDATIVRMLLVPATMELLGDRNWWLPSGLRRVLPRIEIDGTRSSPTEPVDHDDVTVPV